MPTKVVAVEAGSLSKPSKQRKRRDNEDSSAESDDAGSDVEMLDVSFEFFDPQPQDFHSIKLLLSQLFSHDASLLDAGGITELVLEQKLVGSTVKTDGAEGDPYAVLTVLNLNVLKDNTAVKALIDYLLSKSASNSAVHSSFSAALEVPAAEGHSTASNPGHIGLVLSERLVNMPAQVLPPMYRMLGEELQWAREDNEPYHFSTLLFLSRVFLASPDDFEEDPNPSMTSEKIPATNDKSNKKKNNKKSKTGSHLSSKQTAEEQIWMYHPEDEFIAKHAAHIHTFSYTNSPSSQGKLADSFGVETRGQIMIVPGSKFGDILDGLEGFVGSGDSTA